MSDDKTYNGWTNYETWNVALWLDNDQGTHEQCHDMAKDARSESDLAAQLKDMVHEWAPDLGASLFSDLLSAALGEVDWREIAGHYWEDAGRNEDEDEEEG